MTVQTPQRSVQGIRYEAARVPLIVTHHDQDLIFMHPYHGPGTYENVGLSIEQAGLRKPTMAETSSLVYAAFAHLINSEIPDNQFAQEIRDDITGHRWLWPFTRSRYERRRGAFVYDEEGHVQFNGMTVNQLEQLLGQRQENGVIYSDDGRLRFVPFGYQIGETSPLQLVKNPFVIALAGAEGAEKLGEVAGQHRDNPRLYSVNSLKSSLTKVFAFYSISERFYIDGNTDEGFKNGCNFGAFSNVGKANCPK